MKIPMSCKIVQRFTLCGGWIRTYFLKAQRRIGGHELHTYEQVSGDHNMVWRLTLPIKMRFPLTYSYSHLKLKIRYVFDNLPRVVGL